MRGMTDSTPAGAPPLRLDFVSDVSCPWCAVGLAALEIALARVAPQITAELHFQPFELNPDMGPEGEEAVAHLQKKYGIAVAEVEANGEVLRQRGAAVGFAFDMKKRERVWNTFDAHRLLHWAHEVGAAQQLALKKALFRAYFIDGLSPADADVLVWLAEEAGLDGARARQILAGDEFAPEVRQAEALFTGAGIRSVPALIINRQHLLSGGQPPEVFERALRQIAGAQPPQTAVA